MNATCNLPPGCPASAISYGEPEADLAEQIEALKDDRETAFTKYFHALAGQFRTRAAHHLRRARKLGWQIEHLKAEL